MNTIAFALYILGLLAALIAVPLGYPGSVLTVLLAFLYSLVTDFRIGGNDLTVVTTVIVLSALSETYEWRTRNTLKRERGSDLDRPILCAIVGGFLGTLVGAPFTLYRTVLGLFLGVFAGAFLFSIVKEKNFRISLKVTLPACFSRITTLFVKTILALVMTIYLLMRSF